MGRGRPGAGTVHILERLYIAKEPGLPRPWTFSKGHVSAGSHSGELWLKSYISWPVLELHPSRTPFLISRVGLEDNEEGGEIVYYQYYRLGWSTKFFAEFLKHRLQGPTPDLENQNLKIREGGVWFFGSGDSAAA